VVRPDGSIVESTEARTPTQDVPALPPADVEPIAPVAVATTSVNGAGEPEAASGDASEPADSAASATAGADQETSEDQSLSGSVGTAELRPATADPTSPEQDGASAESPTAQPTAEPVETAAAEPSPEPEPPAAAGRRDSGPVDLLSAAPAQEPTPAPSTSGEGWVVQVSSQRSQADAQSSWNSLKSRYSSVLGALEPSIQEADLGAKGVFYRVRVGPWASRDEAIGVCEALQAAGGDCFVGR
jgi:cell division protein FtsN